MSCSMALFFDRGVRGYQTCLPQMETSSRPTFLVYYPKQNKSLEHQWHIHAHVPFVAKEIALDAVSDAAEGFTRKAPKHLLEVLL